MSLGKLLSPLALVLLVACAGRTRPDGAIARDRNVMRITEIQEGIGNGIANVYQLVERNHPEWLSPVRANSNPTSSLPTVWVDTQRYGSVGYLRTLQLTTITGVRYLTAFEARGEFGFDNPGGAIVVSTR